MRFSLLWISIGIVYWFFDSLLDIYVFRSRDFLSAMFYPGAEETWNRLLVIIFMIIVGAVYTNIGTANFKREIKRLKDTEESVRQNHNLLHSIIEGTTDAIYLRDLDSRFLMINSSGARFFGKLPEEIEEIMGKSITELFPPEFIQKTIEADQKTLKSGSTETLENEVTINGKKRTFLTTRCPVRNHENVIMGIFGISRDITDRILSEEKIKSEYSFRKAIEDSLVAGIAAADLDGKLIYVNPAFCIKDLGTVLHRVIFGEEGFQRKPLA